MPRNVINTPNLTELYGSWGIAPAIKTGDLVFLGGQIGIRPDGSVADNPSDQIDQAFANMGLVLASAGATFDDVVDLTAFYTNYPEHGSLSRPIREKYFGTEHLCNWTVVGVSHLAEPFVFEVKAIARVT